MILRVYDPIECDERGVPLDWTYCRHCVGTGGHVLLDQPCSTCGGHGSLKAAALAALAFQTPMLAMFPARCEDCGHPMSEGTYVGPAAELIADPEDGLTAEKMIDDWLAQQRDLSRIRYNADHYSCCDEGCRHAGPWRWADSGDPVAADDDDWPSNLGAPVEASWRPVDVRTLGWPHDLRPEKLAVMCLRCFAERSRA